MERRLLSLMLALMLFMGGGDTTSRTVEKYLYLSEVSDDGSGDVSGSSICLTEECVVTASDILESLDNYTDPCDDFYTFACGGWMRRQILPPHRVSKMTLYDQDQHLAAARNLVAEEPKPDELDSVKKAKILYASCINYTTGVKDFKSIVKVVKHTFGLWPLTSREFNEEEFSLQEFLSKAIRLGVHPLFRLKVELHITLENGQVKYKHLLEFKKPTLGIPIESYASLFKDELNRQIYANKIYSDAKKFGIDDPETAQADALEIVEVEKTLAELYQGLHIADSTVNTTLEQLDVHLGELLNWTEFVSDLASAPDIGITDIDSGESVFVQSPGYMENMTEYFSQLPARTQANYIIWRVVDSLESVLIAENMKMETILKREVLGASSLPSPEESCVAYVSGVFPLVLHRLLYTDQLPLDELRTVSRLLKEIQQEFDQLVDEHNWLDEETTKLVKEKNAALAVTLVNFERAMNDTFLDHYYANVTVKENKFFQNVITERQEAFARNLRSLKKPYQRTVDNLPHELVAQNYFLENQLEFTSVLFEPPLFINNVPMSVNYAGTGMIFGHEIVHAFDDTGIKFSKEGVPGEWWNNETLQVFQERARCLVEQYNKYFYKPAGGHVNGLLTLGENIADSAGVKLAYRAYKKHVARQKQKEQDFPGVPYTDEQVFFIKLAQNWCLVETAKAARFHLKDVHSPNRFRVIGSLQNSKDFPRVFNCPVGSGMNPKRKCEVW